MILFLTYLLSEWLTGGYYTTINYHKFYEIYLPHDNTFLITSILISECLNKDTFVDILKISNLKCWFATNEACFHSSVSTNRGGHLRWCLSDKYEHITMPNRNLYHRFLVYKCNCNQTYMIYSISFVWKSK